MTESLLDSGYGACWLSRPEVAQIIINSFEFIEREGHEILRWVIMPNHIHFMIRIRLNVKLSAVIRSFKSFTAKEANKVLGRSGSFWYPEYFDRYIRDPDHLRKAINYIDRNPIRAGLVVHPEDWIFGSAGRKKMRN
jgi:putative DNA methylase